MELQIYLENNINRWQENSDQYRIINGLLKLINFLFVFFNPNEAKGEFELLPLEPLISIQNIIIILKEMKKQHENQEIIDFKHLCEYLIQFFSKIGDNWIPFFNSLNKYKQISDEDPTFTLLMNHVALYIFTNWVREVDQIPIINEINTLFLNANQKNSDLTNELHSLFLSSIRKQLPSEFSRAQLNELVNFIKFQKKIEFNDESSTDFHAYIALTLFRYTFDLAERFENGLELNQITIDDFLTEFLDLFEQFGPVIAFFEGLINITKKKKNIIQNYLKNKGNQSQIWFGNSKTNPPKIGLLDKLNKQEFPHLYQILIDIYDFGRKLRNHRAHHHQKIKQDKLSEGIFHIVLKDNEQFNIQDVDVDKVFQIQKKMFNLHKYMYQTMGLYFAIHQIIINISNLEKNHTPELI